MVSIVVGISLELAKKMPAEGLESCNHKQGKQVQRIQASKPSDGKGSPTRLGPENVDVSEHYS